MSDTNMMSNYIYLLQEREFIKTNENIYKVGMTEKENHIRFNQYPKGSVLLFQIICRNCRNMENKIKTQFKTEFKLRKDIGNEYFEGDYKNMIDIIYSIVKEEDEIINELEQDKQTEIFDLKCMECKEIEFCDEYFKNDEEAISQIGYFLQKVKEFRMYDLESEKQIAILDYDDLESEEKEIYYLGNYIKKQKESGYILNGREIITEQEFDLKILFFEEEQRQREKNLDLRRKDRNEKEIAEKIKEIEEKYNLEIKRIEEKYNLAIKQYS